MYLYRTFVRQLNAFHIHTYTFTDTPIYTQIHTHSHIEKIRQLKLRVANKSLQSLYEIAFNVNLNSN